MSTVHTWVAVRDNPQAFCIGDFVGANAQYVHIPSALELNLTIVFLPPSAFYDGNVVGNQAGSFLFNTVIPSLKRACPGKPIIIAESVPSSRLESSYILC